MILRFYFAGPPAGSEAKNLCDPVLNRATEYPVQAGAPVFASAPVVAGTPVQTEPAKSLTSCIKKKILREER